MSPSPPLPPLSKHFYKVDQGSVVETDAILYERALCLQRLSFPVFHDRVPTSATFSFESFERNSFRGFDSDI